EDGFARLAWEIHDEDADVIVMQDAQLIATHPREAERVRVALAGRQVYAMGQYLVASRFPLKDCGPGDMSYRGESDEYVRCTLAVRGREIDLYTSHVVSPREGLNAARGQAEGGDDEWRHNFADRLAQADQL